MIDDTAMVNSTELAVAVGRIETDVKHIRDNTERRLGASEQFQLTAREEFNVLSNRITAVESSLGSSLKWISAIMIVATIGVNILMKIL